MFCFDELIVTEIEKPIIVHSQKGRCFHMKDRAFYGLSLCISGQITYTMNGKQYVSTPHNAVLLPQGGTYSLYGDKEGLFPVVNFKCDHFKSDELLVLPLKNAQLCLEEFQTLKNAFLYKENHLHIYSIFYKLLSRVCFENENMNNPLKNVIEYIEENIDDTELSNTKLALKLGISEVYLRKQFVAHLDLTPKKYILNMRIQKAKQMLSETALTVTEIAEKCGFGSLYHFCRSFKEKTGSTPTEYANLNKKYQI